MEKRKLKAEDDEDFLEFCEEPREPKGKKAAARNKVKQVESGAGHEEKRLARWKPKCPKTILERVHRVISQRFYLIDRHREPNALSEAFTVLGSTGNVYTVKIEALPSCTCPDRSDCCKHILFVMLKVLALNWSTSQLWYQKALLSSELQSIFDNAPTPPADVVNQRLTQAYRKQAAGEADAEDEAELNMQDASGAKRRLPSAGDSCPVCYEDLPADSEVGLKFCETSCGGPIHVECLRNWQGTNRGQGRPTTCIYCRAPWPVDDSLPAGGAFTMVEGYTNLASVMGISTERDTSTYYHGPQRGKKWDGGFGRYGGSYGAYDGYY